MALTSTLLIVQRARSYLPSRILVHRH
jgi:hypothetical protein